MNIYIKQYPQQLDLVFTAHDPKDIKAVHAICRKHITGYGGHRAIKGTDTVEFHCEQDIGPWDLERLYQALEAWAYPEPEPEGENKNEI